MASFLKNINMVSRSATLFGDTELSKASPLKGYQSKYLLTVCSNPGVSQDDLARMLFVHKSNVARQIAQLEAEGYVVRREDPSDRRISRVFPTAAAEEILPVIRGVNARWREVICEGFSEEEKKTLYDLTERLYKNAVKYMEEKGD